MVPCLVLSLRDGTLGTDGTFAIRDDYPVGKSIAGDLTKLRVCASIDGEIVEVYDLTATGCPWIEVEIDIEPWSCPNSLNLGSKGVVPVAVLTTGDFDASTIDTDTVRFADASPVKWNMKDVDDDGDRDMLFHLKTQELNLDETSTEAILTGETTDGTPIKGTDTVNIVPKWKVQ